MSLNFSYHISEMNMLMGLLGRRNDFMHIEVFRTMPGTQYDLLPLLPSLSLSDRAVSSTPGVLLKDE